MLRPTGTERCHANKVYHPPKQGGCFQTAYWEQSQDNFKLYLRIVQVSSRKYKPKLGQGQSTVDTFNFQGQGLVLNST